MIERYNQLKKQEYIKTLIANGDTDKANTLSTQDDYMPIFSTVEIHPETEVPKDSFNTLFKEMGLDLDIINNSIMESATQFSQLLSTTKTKLDDIKDVLESEKERREDISILCNKYTNFSNVVLVSDKNTTGTYKYNNGAFSLSESSYKTISGSIVSVTGNGYEGNGYVYKDSAFLKEKSDTSLQSCMLDSNSLTYYEYSRITASNTETEIFPLVNFDSIMARCVVVLKASDSINTLQLSLPINNIILESLSTSTDGQTYIQSSITNVAIADKTKKYDSNTYVYGCGILSFKDCTYVKLVLRATTNTDDVIAFEKIINSENSIVTLSSAKRSVIRISGIEMDEKVFDVSGQIVLSNFITDSISSIAIFANEYACDDLDIRNSISYTLAINGIDYDIVPINSQDNGNKIIKTTQSVTSSNQVVFLNEDIKNATLTIDLKTAKQYATPYISDLKILLGK
jgi:hypothetical protein